MQPCKPEQMGLFNTVTLRSAARNQLGCSPWRAAGRGRPRQAPTAAAGKRDAGSSPPSTAVDFTAGWLAKQSAVMAAASAVLGPLCDGQHSSHDVLHYTDPVQLDLLPALGLHLETCWWVPLLFGQAGIILGISHPYLDAQPWADEPRGGADPSWAWVLAGIACFVAQYAASGALDAPLLGAHLGPVPALDAQLCLTGVAHWWAFDGTRQGLGMALLTALCGPLAEMALINVGHLYQYTHPDFLGIPSWIPWVYFCGSAAVGNLGRRVAWRV